MLCNPPGGVLAAQFILSVKLFCDILRIIDRNTAEQEEKTMNDDKLCIFPDALIAMIVTEAQDRALAQMSGPEAAGDV